MNRRLYISVILVVALMVGGIAFAFLPASWIEMRLGLSPDGGNGLAEFLCVALLVGTALVVGVMNAQRLARARSACSYANFASAVRKAVWLSQRIW